MNAASIPLTERMVNTTIKGLASLICRVDAGQLKHIPARGPLILVTNHVNFLETPIIYTHLRPRPLTGFVKVETWDNPLMGWLFDVWRAIPIRRGEADRAALRRGLAVLQEGQILAIAPEGTRSNHGRLQRGHPGMTWMALQSGAPLIPLAHYGHEQYRQNLPRLRRSDFHMMVGRAFRLHDNGQRVTNAVRQRMTDEIMYQLAALLPPEYRGAYSDIENATQDYLNFIDLK